MLQRAYYTDDDLDTVIADAKQEMKDIACSRRRPAVRSPRRRPVAAAPVYGPIA